MALSLGGGTVLGGVLAAGVALQSLGPVFQSAGLVFQSAGPDFQSAGPEIRGLLPGFRKAVRERSAAGR